ncbi:uncharacterized protein [Montipora capricornis]|uniref:uncharacterized protein n=1 Tax=Montipora capricornis TaxID=246305 RepID=UPI0035F1630E
MNTTAILLLVSFLFVFKTHGFTIDRSDESAIDSSVDHSSDDVLDVPPDSSGGEQDNEDATDDKPGYVSGGLEKNEHERISEDGGPQSRKKEDASAESPRTVECWFEGSSP